MPAHRNRASQKDLSSHKLRMRDDQVLTDLIRMQVAVPIDMLQLVFLQNLTATDIEILLLLMKNSIKNNVVAYDIHGFAETLGLSETSIKKNFMKLKKLNFIKRVKLGKPFSLLQISPHLAWMGDTESLAVALKEWPYPQVPEDRYEKFKYFEDRYSKFVK